MNIDALLRTCESLLKPEACQDAAFNGLQVEGERDVNRLAVAVTADLEVIEAAHAWGADALLVHHGLFWRGQTAAVTGMMRRRLHALLRGGMHLLAYHMPLDVHPTLGNNAELAHRFGWHIERTLPFGHPHCGFIGRLDAPMAVHAWVQSLKQCMNREPLWLPGGPEVVSSIAWCSGAAQDALMTAAEAKVDAFISGEVSERTFYEAHELGVHYIGIGHHASETGGVQRLAQALAEQAALEWQFFDRHNPI